MNKSHDIHHTNNTAEAPSKPSAFVANPTKKYGWSHQFSLAFFREVKKLLHPFSIAKASVPVAVILACGMLGFLFADSIGFVAGCIFGNLICNHIKPAQALKELREELHVIDIGEDEQ